MFDLDRFIADCREADREGSDAQGGAAEVDGARAWPIRLAIVKGAR